MKPESQRKEMDIFLLISCWLADFVSVVSAAALPRDRSCQFRFLEVVLCAVIEQWTGLSPRSLSSTLSGLSSEFLECGHQLNGIHSSEISVPIPLGPSSEILDPVIPTSPICFPFLEMLPASCRYYIYVSFFQCSNTCVGLPWWLRW